MSGAEPDKLAALAHQLFVSGTKALRALGRADSYVFVLVIEPLRPTGVDIRVSSDFPRALTAQMFRDAADDMDLRRPWMKREPTEPAS